MRFLRKTEGRTAMAYNVDLDVTVSDTLFGLSTIRSRDSKYRWDNEIWYSSGFYKHGGNYFIFYCNCHKVNSRNTAFTLQCNPPEMAAWMYVIGQRNALLHCNKNWARFNFFAQRPCIVLLEPSAVASLLRRPTGSNQINERCYWTKLLKCSGKKKHHHRFAQRCHQNK